MFLAEKFYSAPPPESHTEFIVCTLPGLISVCRPGSQCKLHLPRCRWSL